MADSDPILYLVSGKIAAGKSTLARELAGRPSTVLVSEDQWLSALYPDEMTTIENYMKYSMRLREIMGVHVQSLLQNGVSVVLDFPANTTGLRTWMRGIFEAAGVRHELHYLDVPDGVCKERLTQRNRNGTHEFTPSSDEFNRITSYFEPPTAEEGFNLTVHS